MNNIRNLIPFSVFLDVVGAIVVCYIWFKTYRVVCHHKETA